MKRNTRLSVLLVSVAIVGLVGCKKDSPTSPDIVPRATTSTVPQIQRLSIGVVAPYIGQTLNTVIEQALTQGLTATGSARWTKNCPSGGNARVDLPANYQVQTGSVVMLADTELVLTDCETETNGATFLDSPTLLGRLLNLIVRPLEAQARPRIFIRGRTRTRGKWRPPIMSGGRWTYRDEPVRMTGSIEVNQANCGGNPCPTQIGSIQLDCGVNGSVCAGSIGGVGVTQGPPDTPPPPNPTSTTTTTTTTIPPTPPPGSGFSVSPSPLSVGTANWCTGSTTMGTATLTTGSTVNWTVRLQFTTELANLNFTLNRTSGTGSGTVTVTMRGTRVPGGCVGIRGPAIANALFFTGSGGQQLVVPVVGDLFLLH
jgi:hypothetical protein